MYTSRILYEYIDCQLQFKSSLIKKLSHYADTLKPFIYIYLKEPNTTRSIKCIPPTQDYEHVIASEFIFAVRNSKQLYAVLVTLIRLDLKYLIEVGYHSTGAILEISVPSTPTDYEFYHFSWILKH